MKEFENSTILMTGYSYFDNAIKEENERIDCSTFEIESGEKNEKMYDYDNLLNEAKNILKDEMGGIAYSTWIKPLEIESIKDNKITLIVKSKLSKDAIESKFFELLINAFNVVTNRSFEIYLMVKEEKK